MYVNLLVKIAFKFNFQRFYGNFTKILNRLNISCINGLTINMTPAHKQLAYKDNVCADINITVDVYILTHAHAQRTHTHTRTHTTHTHTHVLILLYTVATYHGAFGVE